MTPDAQKVLAAAGYLTADGTPSEGMVLGTGVLRNPSDAARLAPLMSDERGGLGADAVFRVGTSPVIIFKSTEASTNDELEWHRIAWNAGAAPLLWVTTPQYVRLYNAYQPPKEYNPQTALLREFPLGQATKVALRDLQNVCGRRHVAMGSFWRSELARPIDRRSRIDNVLLFELEHLLRKLVDEGLRPALAQKLAGRCIFLQYLIHRGYIADGELEKRFGAPDLRGILTNLEWTYSLFRWMRRTFNGDLFPIEDEASEREQLRHDAGLLSPLADFFGRFNVSDRQGRFFPFRFDAIPVELISSIYEKFVHMSEADGVPPQGVHYTPINLVDLVLDPVFEGLPARAKVFDPACGSGVFLVESMRRLVWLRTRNEPLTRELIRSVLMEQVRGADISSAALSVAAFSLYLALLELDPSPPSGLDALDCLKFEPLADRVLFARSAFDPGLANMIARVDGSPRFDAIVGNPPWTYSSEEKQEDRALARGDCGDGGDEDEDEADLLEVAAEEEMVGTLDSEPSRRSGTTYARLERLPIPPRSTDWPFLWRCRDLRHEETRIALVMKATPFFSLDPTTSAARDRLLRAFPNVGLVNLSQLRTSRLFQEYEDDAPGKRRKKRAAGPAMLFFSNCLPVNAGSVTTINLPWTPGFQRTGVFELPAEPPKVVPLDAAAREPALLKASFFGTERDVWFLERLARNDHAIRLDEWLRTLNLAAGQGYQVGSKMPSAHLKGLPIVSAADFGSPRLPFELDRFTAERVHRARDPAIYRGPLVLIPEGKLTVAPVLGRYTAIFDHRDLAYNRSFMGVSFHGHGEPLAKAFAAVMNSALIAHQIAFMGGTVGVKQTKVELADLECIRVPRLETLDATMLAGLAEVTDTLAAEPNPHTAKAILHRLDKLVADAIALSEPDRELLADADRRARAVFFETPNARRPMDLPPTSLEVGAYATNLCAAFNAFASDAEDLVLVPNRYSALRDDLLVVRFSLAERAVAPAPDLRAAALLELGEAPFEALGGSELPYLKPAKNLRLYTENAVYILKPAHYRHFSPAAGQSDGDRIVADLMEPDFTSEAAAVRA
jgi:hypothetical protein